MPYRWTSRRDVDETVVVVMNSVEEEGTLPEWLRRTIQGSIDTSDPQYVRYFYDEVKRHVPTALKLFEESPYVP
ncbi:hypothetical protein E2N92_00095 [Methanofollis formosanus]|uniref:Uncharacterized protein n=1 Tax=Methanofollis formosanus TaxID=299308 RepID=A0A8G1A0P0_9EURY|nr:hypothetical protein [Methanofollis formosanus]QYZ77937.1 hypothetical protein E2N92_00095 [Methanofollis formosanus]